MILAIDPGTTESGWCYFDGRVLDAGIWPNAQMLGFVATREGQAVLAIEMVASYGMAVGKEVFETVRWIGRFQQAWREPESVKLVYRQDVKLHLCKSVRAKDANIRQALIDRFDKAGTKGVTGHAWAALAVAVTVYDTMKTEVKGVQ
jgi:hypothetical protein